MAKDFYEILGVSKSASQDEIKRSFRKLAHEVHPDKAGSDQKKRVESEAKFKEINQAYQVLSDSDKRQKYDQFGSSYEQAGGAGPFGSAQGGFNWQDFASQYGGGGGGNPFGSAQGGFDFGDLGDVFGDMFGFGGGRGRGRKQSNRGQDLEARLKIDFREAVFGVEKEVELYRNIACSHCNGSGAEPGSKIDTCATCGGKGQVTSVQRTILGNFQTRAVCPDCSGEGKRAEKKCSKCHGQGRAKELQKIKVKVPAGIDNGQTIKISGQGDAGAKGASAGDLYLHMIVNEDREFRREGDNILSKMEVPFSVLALGGKIKVKTLEEEVTLKIPAGTRSGQVFSIRGQGVPRLKHWGRGDQLVEVNLATPDKLTKRQKELLEELGKEGM